MRFPLLAPVLSLFLLGCEGSTETVRVAMIEVSPGPLIEVPAGVQVRFTAIAYDATGNQVARDFVWASSDRAVATINTSGEALGIAPGTATISASADGVKGTTIFRVRTLPR